MYSTGIITNLLVLLTRVNVNSGQFNPLHPGQAAPALPLPFNPTEDQQTISRLQIINQIDDGVEANKITEAKKVVSDIWLRQKPSSEAKYIEAYRSKLEGNNKEKDDNKEDKVSSLDPVFNEILDGGKRNNSKRGALDLYKMVKCGTGCNPLVYKGYGCYCGFLGSGGVVDGIDRCCKMHDWCYTQTTCMNLEYHLPYFFPYKWTCNGGAPYCITGRSRKTSSGSCSHQLCECDREFVECLKEFPCPRKKAMCRSPWRYWQNLFMGLGTGMEVEHHNHRQPPRSFVQRRPKKNRFEVLFG